MAIFLYHLSNVKRNFTLVNLALNVACNSNIFVPLEEKTLCF